MSTDDLYGLSLDEFTAARDALAKELRAAGERQAAGEVKRLRRPTVAAWAINRAARAHPDDLRDLLGAGAALRRAHERLLSGKGDRSVLREASEHERAAVGAFADVVAATAAAAGQPLSEAALTKVRETLHAATVDDEVRSALEGGRLEREATAIGGAGAFAATGTVPREGPSGSGPKPDDAKRSEARREARRPASGREATSRAQREAAIKALREADRAAARAEREAEAARRRVDRAGAGVERARAVVADAEAELDRERERLEVAQREVRGAKAALGAAQSALDAVEG